MSATSIASLETAWPADHVERWPISKLIPNARNARTHSPEQVKQIAASMREWGWTMPVLCDEDGGIIAGHGRVMGAELNGYTEAPVMVARGWSEPKKRAYMLADNKLALNAGWDRELLALEVSELRDLAFDVTLTGFDASEIEDLFKPEAEEIPKDPRAEELLNAAWSDWCTECRAAYDALAPLRVATVGLNRSAAKIYFLRALYYKKRFPHAATLPHNPHRLSVAGDAGSLLDLIDRKLAPRLRFVLADLPMWDRLLSGGLAAAGCRQPLDFPAELAQALIDEYTPEGGRVLDPCHGWGGRAVGFLLSRAAYYLGHDPSPETFEGVRTLTADLLPYTTGKTIETRNVCYEDAELADESFDFALTSPPYFDTEKYTGAEQSFVRYPSFAAWNTSFYGPLIRKTAAALRTGAVFALQVGNQRHPLEAQAIAHAKRCGFVHVATRTTDMVNNQFPDSAREDGEVIVILRKETHART